jgi:hypothetical protein
MFHQILIVLVVSVLVDGKQQYKECLIYNQQYSNQYLYGSHSSVPDVYFASSVFLIPLDKVDDTSKLKWQLVPTRATDQSFYLKTSKRPAEYLCSDQKLLDVFTMKREMIKAKVNNMTSENCEWRFEKTLNAKAKREQDSYLILNKAYNNRLFTPFLSGVSMSSRSVFLWHKSNNNEVSWPNRFKWIVDCKEIKLEP